jgi:spermidine synthase
LAGIEMEDSSESEARASPSSPRAVRGCCCVVAFLAGTVLLAEELLAAGWMAPVFGSGIDVWAGILGVTLTAMAAGYFVGSFASHRIRVSHLPLLLAAAGVGVVLAVSVLRVPLTPRPEASDSGLALIGFAGVVLGLPIFPLAVLSPWLVQVYSGTETEAGRASGVTYAVSTLGGVLGAIGAGFWAIPHLGLARSTTCCVLTLLAACLCCALLVRSTRRTALLSAAALLLAVLVAETGDRASQRSTRVALGERMRLRHQSDTWYGQHAVYEDDRAVHLFVNGVPQSSADIRGVDTYPRGSLLGIGYVTELLPYLRPEGREALVVGLGGGVVSSFFKKYGWKIMSVEIDPAMLELARRYFGFRGECVVMDGRRYLRANRDTYDFVHLDVYRGEELPPHMTTREFFELVASRLRPGGVLAMNLISAPDGEDTGALLRTLETVFPEVALYSPVDRGVGTLTVLASGEPLVLPAKERAKFHRVPEPLDLSGRDWTRYELLTDDRNPVAILRRGAASEWRRVMQAAYGR